MMYTREELTKAIIEHKQKALEAIKRKPPQAVVENMNRRIALLEALLLKMHRGEIDMEKLNLLLSDTIYKAEEIMKLKGKTGHTEAIEDLVKGLKPGEFKQLDPKTVNPNSFYQTVTRLRKDGRIPEDVVFVRTKNGMFLGKQAEEKTNEA